MAVLPMICRLCGKPFGVVNATAARTAPLFCSDCLKHGEQEAIRKFEHPVVLAGLLHKGVKHGNQHHCA